MSGLLPMKESHRRQISRIAAALHTRFPQITNAWRKQMFREFKLDGRVMAALERLTVGTGFTYFCHRDFSVFYENTTYYGKRLAKLQVNTRIVARSLEMYLKLTEPFLKRIFDPGARTKAMAVLDAFTSSTFVSVSSAYFDTQKTETTALLAVLDAELNARSLDSLLKHVLQVTVSSCGAPIGTILLREGDPPVLRARAQVGFGQEIDDVVVELGVGLSGRIAETGEPEIVTELTQSRGRLNALCREKAESLWGMPLRTGDAVIGVLLIGFAKPYAWLPTERELLHAIADRSAQAIERAGLTEALREREARIAELSGHLLKAQEEERKRISRELHDETGQALMVIRLYLGMLEGSVVAGAAKDKIQETLEVVDRAIEGIRRIIAKLSPLVLQELGLIAAIRKEAKDLTKSTGIKAKVSIPESVGRFSPVTETAIYRVVQEALHNVAKHAAANLVNIQLRRDGDMALLSIEDDGVGINLGGAKPNTGRRSFGLAGMRERVSTLGGTMVVGAGNGDTGRRGTRIEIAVPAVSPGSWHDRGLMMRPEEVDPRVKGTA